MVGDKPDLLIYEMREYDTYKQDVLVWCAEAMQDAAARIEIALDEPKPNAKPRRWWKPW